MLMWAAFLLLFFAVSGLSCCIYLVGLQFCINTYHELRYAFVIVLKQLFENTLAVKTTLKLNMKSLNVYNRIHSCAFFDPSYVRRQCVSTLVNWMS